MFILCHGGVHLIHVVAYIWERPAVLASGKGECFYFYCFSLSFISLVHLCPSLSSPLLSLLSLFSLSLGDDAKWPTRVEVSLNPNTTINHVEPFVEGRLRVYSYSHAPLTKMAAIPIYAKKVFFSRLRKLWSWVLAGDIKDRRCTHLVDLWSSCSKVRFAYQYFSMGKIWESYFLKMY